MTTQVLMSTPVVAEPLSVRLPYEPPIERTPERAALKQVPRPIAEPTPFKRVVPIADRLIAPSSCPLPTVPPNVAPAPSQTSAVERRLPYQASHQAELLCLQAEVDALWQQLQAIRQERQSSINPDA